MSELKDSIIQMATQQKMSGYEIASILGCSQAYVSETLKFAGISSGFRIDWDSYDRYILDMLDEGMSYRDIASKIDIGYETLRYHCLSKGWIVSDKHLRATETKKNVEMVIVDGREMYDYTDYHIDRPCICEIPEWKNQLQRDGIIFFGIK